MKWNDDSKVAVQRKEAAWKDTLKAKDDIVYVCMCMCMCMCVCMFMCVCDYL